MPQAPALSPLCATSRSAAPHDDGAGAGPRDDRAPGRDQQTAPTHTVVFFPPVLGCAKPRPGRGVVLDEQWTVTAKFTAGASVSMIGACGGLFCLLDVRTCAVGISNPLTGEKFDLPPPPPCTSTRHDPRAFCLGFDAIARRYKIVHVPRDYKNASSASTGKGVVHVLRVGEKYWRLVPVRSPSAACCLAAGGAVYSDGAAYWLTHYKAARARFVRFDLSEEESTSVELPPCHSNRRRPLYCRLMDADAAPCVVTSLRHDPTSGESFAPSNSNDDDIDMWRLEEDGIWARRPCGLQLRRLLRRLSGPHAVPRGHLLLQREDGALCAHGIEDRGVVRIERAGEKMLVEGSSRGRWRGDMKVPVPPDTVWPCGGGESRPARVKRETVVPIMGILELPLYRDRTKKSDDERCDRGGEKAQGADRPDPPRGGRRGAIRTFGYVEPVSAATLTQHLGLGASGWTRGG